MFTRSILFCRRRNEIEFREFWNSTQNWSIAVHCSIRQKKVSHFLRCTLRQSSVNRCLAKHYPVVAKSLSSPAIIAIGEVVRDAKAELKSQHNQVFYEKNEL
jgi:hypothetical protein